MPTKQTETYSVPAEFVGISGGNGKGRIQLEFRLIRPYQRRKDPPPPDPNQLKNMFPDPKPTEEANGQA